MGFFFDPKLLGLSDVFSQVRERVSGLRPPDEGLQSILEAVVEGTDSRIRLVGGYRRKLQKGVMNALEFVNGLVEQIPSAIEVSSGTFVSNPYVNAFFANVSDIHSILNCSSEVREFVKDRGIRSDLQCCCLLCMRKTERRILGMDLSGDMLRREVEQTAVSFSDHRIYSPAPDEAAAREGLRECLMGGLINKALEHIMRDKADNHRLQNERHMLHLRLRHLEYKAGDGHGRMQLDTSLEAEIIQTREKLRTVEDRLMNLRPATPQESLNHVNHLFARPEEFIHLRKASLKLDKMGIKIDKTVRQASNDIELAEVVIGDQPPRVVTLARFTLGEFSRPLEALTH